MKKLKPWIVVFVIIGILLLLRWYFFPGEQPTPTSKAPVNMPVNVSVYVAKNEILSNQLFASGTLISNESVQLQPETQGKVTAIYFKEGQFVSAGSLLVKLNDAELQATQQKTAAQIKIAEEKTNRLKKLLDMNGVSKEEYETALNQLQSLQADIEITRARIAQTEIRAPFSGIAGLKSISVGSFVSPTSQIATLEQPDPMKLDISIPEKYTDLLKIGSVFSFTVEGSSGTYQGRIYAADPKMDVETRSLKLRAICPNPGNVLRAGSFAKIELQLNSKTNALTIPTQALVPDLNAIKIYLIKNGSASPQLVKTGLRTQDRIEITDGLHIGDSVVVSGVMQVKPGSRVNVVK